MKSKKYFLAATLVLCLGAAVYLNWSMSSASSTKVLGESTLVNATVSTQAESSQKSTKLTKTTAKASNTGLTTKEKEFFTKAETKRKQAQDEIIDTANETLKLNDTEDKDKTEAQLQVAGVIKNFVLQDTVETTLNAKGFTRALCYITDQGCVITVRKAELSNSSSMVIKATVKSVTNIDFDKITIVTI